MLAEKFVHLHLHTKYSILDGMIEIDELIDDALKRKTKAIAITDHGTIMGVVELYSKCKQNDLKPIIGCEAYLSDDSTIRDPAEKHMDVTLLAKNYAGFRNLIALNTWGTMYFYKKPRIDKYALAKYSDGLIVLSGCINGILARKMSDDSEFEREFDWFEDTFGNDFYLEIQPNHDEKQWELNKKLISTCEDKILPTNDAHYLRKSDAEIHNVMLLLQTGKTLRDREKGEEVFQFTGNDFYLKNQREMIEIFESNHDINITPYIANIQQVIDKVEDYSIEGELKIPVYEEVRREYACNAN